MRLVAIAFVLAGSGLIAQSPTGFGRYSNPSGIPPSQAGGGFGRLIYPGTGGPPAVRRPGQGLGPGFRPGALPAVPHPPHNGPILVPYPVFYGGYYYGYDAPPAPPAGDEYGAGYTAQQPSPVVIINQNFRPDTVNPVIRDYSNVQLPPAQYQGQAPAPASDQPPANDAPSIVFLIAMKDHTIFPAVAYWVEGDILNYVTTQGVHNRASLDLVDREFSKQLNRERSIDFALPGAK